MNFVFSTFTKRIFLVAFATLTLGMHNHSTKVILFFGDSITAGYGLSMVDAFPALVENILNREVRPVKVINAGLSGETSAGGLSRIDWILQQPFDVFVLELGANDALRGLPVEATQNNLQAIINRVKTKNPKIKIVLAGMQAPPNLGQDYTTAFKNMYPELAKKNNITLIPFLLRYVGGDPGLNLSDGIHPNKKGHKIIADRVAKIVAPLL